MKQSDVKRDDGVELETQLILRIPKEPANILREAIQSGANNLKDRLSIKLEQDLRYGEVRFDHWLMHAKIVDLPTVIESLKSIDNKSFYKTADICQLMICKDEPDAPSADEESPNKAKKKDPNKVDKKFLWPHGITPPCKNVRKRRFRKTLKKKYVEAPEIEKEVKRLLRVDNEAVNVKYEIINEDDDQGKGMGNISQPEQLLEQEELKVTPTNTEKTKKQEILMPDLETPPAIQTTPRGVGEHEIFGEEVSSSEDEENPNVHELEETSRLSADDSRLSDFSMPSVNMGKIVTEFNKSMFSPKGRKSNTEQMHAAPQRTQEHSREFYEPQERPDFDDFLEARDQINARVLELRRQSDDLKNQQALKAQEIASIQNPTLRQRMQETLDNLISQILDKDREIQKLQGGNF